MTTPSRQLMEDILRGRKPERVALYENVWPDTLAAWTEQGYPTIRVHKEAGAPHWRRTDGREEITLTAGLYEQPVPLWQQFDYDLLRVSVSFDTFPWRGYREVIEETDEWETVRNGAGGSLRYWKHKSGTPEHIDFRMVTREIWERDYRSHLLALDPLRFNLDQARNGLKEAAAAGKWIGYNSNFIWEILRSSLGDVTLYENLLLDPDWIQDFNRVYTDFFKMNFKFLFENAGMPAGVWFSEDLGYKNGLFASPKALGKLIFPYFKEMVDFLHGYNLPVILHSCGSVLQALPMILDAGFDALHPMERKAKDNDPFLFAEKYGDKIAFIGGLDARILETNDPDLIKREVASYIRGMKERGARLIFSSDHSISTLTRYESYKLALDVYRDNMLY